MNWFSLIPAALGLMGGIFSGGQKTSTTTPTMSPALKKAADAALAKANAIWKQPYQSYAGERVAGPTASRSQINTVMRGIGPTSAYGAGPARVTAPTLVPNGARATLTNSPM